VGPVAGVEVVEVEVDVAEVDVAVMLPTVVVVVPGAEVLVVGATEVVEEVDVAVTANGLMTVARDRGAPWFSENWMSQYSWIS
jgi:hypothetical protein